MKDCFQIIVLIFKMQDYTDILAKIYLTGHKFIAAKNSYAATLAY